MDQGDVTTYRTRVAGTIDSMENTYHITFVRFFGMLSTIYILIICLI
jgi:hypothetical protein